MFDETPECGDQRRELASTTSEPSFVDQLKWALRVLNAITVTGHADPSDVAELRRLVPSRAGAPVEVLASEVILWSKPRAEVQA
jgi:hypothetical protein